MRILIAEDDPTSRVLLERLLTKWGYEVVVTSDGAEAWEVLAGDDAPSMAILDWMMPHRDGVEICRLLRQEDEDVPRYLILLTARGGKENTITGLEAGADDYVEKPFDRDELRARVDVGARVVKLQNALAQRVAQLEEAWERIERLQGVLPICMHCHKIRDEEGQWQRLERYIDGHSDAQLSHGICPDCLTEHYPEYAQEEEIGEEGKQT
jgi:DNA-binding response OmpR family regulator